MKRHLRSSGRRLFSVLSTTHKGSLIGFESSPYLNSQLDCTLLEKSIRNGCKSIVCRGAGNDVSTTNIVELLIDLSITEDIDLQQSLVGLCLQGEIPGTDRVKVLRELTDSMGPRQFLDFANIPLRLTPSGAVDPICLEEHIDLQKSVKESNGALIGIDMTTSLLSSLSSAQVEALVSSLQSHDVPILTVATNVLTCQHAARIIQWANSRRNIQRVISTETLRANANSPALLAVYPNTITDKTTMAQAVEDFKHATDRCLQLEKHFLEKMRSEVPDLSPTDICWAHVLMQTQHSIQSPEEWHYLLATQIMPKLDKSSDLLRAHSKSAGEWAALHAGLARYMFSTFSSVQESRRVVVCREILESRRTSEAPVDASIVISDVHSIPQVLGDLVSSLGSSTTCLSGCEVYHASPSRSLEPATALRVLKESLAPVAKEFY